LGVAGELPDGDKMIVTHYCAQGVQPRMKLASTEGGALFSVENAEVIKRYINLCLVEPKDPATLLQAGAAVAREVKNRMLGFFQSAEEEEDKKLSAKSEMTSPSADTAPTASMTSAS